MGIRRPDTRIPYSQETGQSLPNWAVNEDMSPETISRNKLMLLYFRLHALIDVISKPLTELPLNFEIRYADEDFCCSVDVDVDGISAWGITASIGIIGVAAGVMNCTIEWLNPCQSI